MHMNFCNEILEDALLTELKHWDILSAEEKLWGKNENKLFNTQGIYYLR